MKKLILASASKRRRDLLRNSGYIFDIIASDVDESLVLAQKLSPEKTVNALAALKAESVLDKAEDNSVIIGSDTIVVVGDEILGKPEDKNGAFEMLKSLSGKVHTVYTSVCIIEKGGKRLSFTNEAKVHMSKLCHEEILQYIATNEPMDKAGGYGIQGLGGLFVESIEGDFFAIEGLPVNRVYFALKEFEIFPNFGEIEYI